MANFWNFRVVGTPYFMGPILPAPLGRSVRSVRGDYMYTVHVHDMYTVHVHDMYTCSITTVCKTSWRQQQGDKELSHSAS